MHEKNLNYQPNQLRWKPIPALKEEEHRTFVEGLVSLAGAGEPSLKQGMAIYGYSANKSMERSCFYNSDGDMLIVPYIGTLYLKTLMGKLVVNPR